MVDGLSLFSLDSLSCMMYHEEKSELKQQSFLREKKCLNE
jgi:hypothetical protein